MIEFLMLIGVLSALGCFFFNSGKFRPLAWLNLFVALILLPGSLVYSEFYPKLEAGESLKWFLMFFLFFISLWVVITSNINIILKKSLSSNFSIDRSFVFVWRTLLLFITFAGLAVVVERGGIQETGLWGMLFDAERYNLLRDLTHKSMDNSFVKKLYSYSLMFVPFIAASAFVLLKHRKYRKEAILGLLVAVFIAVLSGARSHVVTILLCYLLFTIISMRSLPIKKIAFVVFVAFVVVVSLSALRSDRTSGYEDISMKTYQVARRVIAAPFYTGVVHMEYVQQYGMWDYSSIIGFPGKGLFELEHINHFRVVGEWESGIETSNLNTSEIFLEMSVFGVVAGGVVAIMMFIIADLLMLSIVYMKKSIRFPLFVTLVVYLESVISTGIIELIFKSVLLVAIVFVLLLVRDFFVQIVQKNNPGQIAS